MERRFRNAPLRGTRPKGKVAIMKPRINRGDLIGIAIILLISTAAFAFRDATIAPRAFVALCAAPHAPLVCIPRHAVLWAQYQRLFGITALILGLLAFAFANRPLGVAALAIGTTAIINYNGTEGIIGAALGLWGWLEARSPRYHPPNQLPGDKNARQ
ncbi:MAG TPA: hypothetical protein PK677_01655 [Acidiphilium sp.]|nr:hypothetical protein [Acidiphilium sp.]